MSCVEPLVYLNQSQRTHTVSGTVNQTLFVDGDQTSASGTRLGRFLMDFSPLKAPLSDISGRKRVRQHKSQISHPRRSERPGSDTSSLPFQDAPSTDHRTPREDST